MWRFLHRNLRGNRAIVAVAISMTFVQVGADILTAFPLKFILDKVVHHIDASWNEAWRGTNQVRFCELQGRMLTYVSAPARSPMTGRDCVHTVVFERAG